MDRPIYLIRFDNVSGETASLYASELRDALLDVTRDVEVDLKRADLRTQDFGNALEIVLAAPAVVAIAKALGEWLKLRYSASLSIQKDGHVLAKNLTSKDVLRLAELLKSEK